MRDPVLSGLECDVLDTADDLAAAADRVVTYLGRSNPAPVARLRVALTAYADAVEALDAYETRGRDATDQSMNDPEDP